MTTGTDLIRLALRMKNKKLNLGSMARDLAMPLSTLEDYAESRIKTLSPDLLQKIVGHIWPNGATQLDVERDLLFSNPPPSTPLAPGGYPEPFKPDARCIDMIAVAREVRTPRPSGPPKKTGRPGWKEAS